MAETIVGLFWTAAGAYAAAGLLFAVPFVMYWSNWLDPAARAGSWGFRLAILPGAVALWPMMGWKILRVLRGVASPPDPEYPVRPSVQRLIHGVSIVSLAIILPSICVPAIFYRPGELPSTASQLQPAALPSSVVLRNAIPERLPVHASLRTDGNRDQIELEVSHSIDEPVVALFWSRQAEPNRLPSDAIFLGSLWGPARLLFDLPRENRQTPGAVFFVALTGEQRVLARLPLDPL